MKRSTVWLTEQQIEWINERADELGIKAAEYLRRIIDEARKKEESNDLHALRGNRVFKYPPTTRRIDGTNHRCRF